MKTGLIWVIFSVFFFIDLPFASAQNIPLTPYGVPVINSVSLYRKSITGYPGKQMVSLKSIPGIILDLRYASEKNFMHKKLYPANTKTTFL